MFIFCGPLGNKFVYSNEAKFKNWFPRCAATALSLLNTNSTSPSWRVFNDQTHKIFRLESKSMQDHVGVIDSKAREHMEKHWVPYGEVKVQSISKAFVFSLAFHLLISSDAELEREIDEPFQTLAERLLSVPVNLPGTSYNNALKASKVVQDKIMDLIQRKKAEILLAKENNEDIDIESQELLTRMLIVLGEEETKSVSDEEVVGQMIVLLFAGFHSTSTMITSILGYLADYPDVYAKVLQEQLEIAQSKKDGELLTWEDVQRMKYTWNVACETMRLKPPGLGGFRETITDISFGGFTVPKGEKVHWNAYSTHMDPTYFPNPEKFDPSRFEEKLPPNVFVPFGGGAHLCRGMGLARIKGLVYIHNVVTRFNISKVNPNEKVVYRPHPSSVDGLRIRLHPHQK